MLHKWNSECLLAASIRLRGPEPVHHSRGWGLSSRAGGGLAAGRKPPPVAWRPKWGEDSGADLKDVVSWERRRLAGPFHLSSSAGGDAGAPREDRRPASPARAET